VSCGGSGAGAEGTAGSGDGTAGDGTAGDGTAGDGKGGDGTAGDEGAGAGVGDATAGGAGVAGDGGAACGGPSEARAGPRDGPATLRAAAPTRSRIGSVVAAAPPGRRPARWARLRASGTIVGTTAPRREGSAASGTVMRVGTEGGSDRERESP
jgi:syndecan 1